MSRPTIQPIPLVTSRNLYSTIGGASTYVNFVNGLDVDAKISWIDHSGNRIFYGTVKPGQTFHQQTYVGHPWEVTTDGGYRALFMPSATESTAYLDFPTVRPLPSQVSQNLLSVDGKATITVLNFINELKVDAQLCWINHQGHRVSYGTLKPGEIKQQETFVGHPWEVVAAPNIKEVYLPLRAERRLY